MNLIPSKTPCFLKRIFPHYTWSIATQQKEIYLTFDDGPTPEITQAVLKYLKTYNAKATFFCIGQNVERCPELFHQLIKDGHAIGNHTYNHEKGWQTPTIDYLKSIKYTQCLINGAFEKHHVTQPLNPLFRPPHGQITNHQAEAIQNLGYKIIMWDVLSLDWKTIHKDKQLNKIYKISNSGSILVFHDSVKAAQNMLYMLPRVLEYFTNNAYHFKPLIL